MSQITQSVEPRDIPYFGLDYYEEKFGAWFFGRETEASKITNNLRAARLTLLHADSGVGKSSLLRAGVAWRMRKLADDSFARRGTVRSVPIVFISWKDNPVGELVDTIRSAIRPYLGDRPEPELPADRLDAAIGAAADAVNANLLIMLDQFEEYFLYRSREPVPEQFADELARCINRTDLRANFLIAIREDAYASLGDLFKGRIANVYGNFLHIDYLDRAAAEDAIRKPLDVYNSQPSVSEPVRIEDELVDAVLAQVRALGGNGDTAQHRAATNGDGSGRVATPLLQLVMDSVWKQGDVETTHELRYSTLQNLHGVEMIVDTHLNQALDALGRAERQTAIDTIDHLVTPSGGKIAQSVFDLASRTGHSEGQVGSVLEKLDNERIVRPIPAAPGQDPERFRRYEIFHDVLAPSINRAIAVAREVQRRGRRRRRITALAGGTAIVALAVVVAFTWALVSANAAKTTAQWSQLMAKAEANLPHDPELSAQLAMQALLHGRDTGQAEDVLRAALPGLQAMRTFQDGTTVYSAAFDPADESKVASVDEKGVAWIWDVKTGHRVGPMSLGGYNVTGTADAVAFDPAGTQVAVGYADGTVAVFDARTGKELKPAANLSGFPAVNGVEFVGGTGELAIATRQGVFLWQREKGSPCCATLSSTAQANAIAADPVNSREFAVATPTGTAIWSVSSSGQLQRQQPLGPQGLSSGTNDAEFNLSGTQVVTADADGGVTVYDLKTFKVVMTLDAGQASALSAAFSRDGQYIVAGYLSGTASVWDVSSRLQLTVLEGSTSAVDAARFSADGKEVVTASDDGTVRVWYAQPRWLQAEFTDSWAGGPANPVDLIAYLGDGRVLSLDGPGHLYVSMPNGNQQGVIYQGSAVNAVSWDRAGTELVSAQANGTVDLWRAVGKGYTQVRFLTGGPAQDVEMTPDGSRVLVVNSNDNTIQVLSASTGQQVQAPLSPTNNVYEASFSPSGQILAGDYNGEVEVFTPAGKHWVRGKPGPSIDDIESNRSGSEFATATANGKVTIWTTRDDQPLLSIAACPSPETASFSPDGSKIVVACGDGTVRVYDTATGQELATLQAASAGIVTGAAFSPDGKSIVTSIDGGTTGCVEIWSSGLATTSVQALEQIAEQRLPSELTPAQLQGYLTGTSG